MLTLRSSREIGLMRKPGLLVWLVHREAARHIQPGMTTAEIDAVAQQVYQRFDAVPLFRGVPGPNNVPFPSVTCISVNEEVVHGIPGNRVLREGDIVSIDTGCKIGGWCGDAAVTHPVGEVSGNMRKLLEITRQTLHLAIELMGQRELWSEVAAEMEGLVRRNQLAVVESFVGHGIGREMHEEPQVPNFVTKKLRQQDILLRPGLVLAIEPMVSLGSKQVKCRSDQWTQVTADGKPSAHFEHTVALTSDGPRILTGPPETEEERAFLGLRDDEM